MGLTLAVLCFFALCVAWAVLPLLPGLMEALRRTDVRPLRVVRDADTEIRHFSQVFRARVVGALGELMATCKADATSREGELDDGSPFMVLPAQVEPRCSALPDGGRVCDAVLAGCGDLGLPPATVFAKEIYCAGALTVGESTVCRAVLADGDVRFGRRACVLRWVHAAGTLVAREECAFHGRASSDRAIRLEVGCLFERLQAPSIAFGAPMPLPAPPARRTQLSKRDIPNLVEDAAGRWLVRGRLALPPASMVMADLVVTGALSVGAGAQIAGSLKSQRDLVLGDGVEITGCVFSGRHLHVGCGCRVLGAVVAEGDAKIKSGTRIGALERPATVSVRRLAIEAGSVAHGSVRTSCGGGVTPSPRVASAALAALGHRLTPSAGGA